jgi:hypothetical protein
MGFQPRSVRRPSDPRARRGARPARLVRSTDTIPDTSYGVDERVGLLTIDLAADAPDVDVHGVGRGIKMQIPNMLQQHCPRNDLARIANQIFENLKFSRQQLDVPSAAGHGS